MIFLEHILRSFTTHYHIDIEELEFDGEEEEANPQQVFQNLLVTQDKEDEIKSSTAGNSERGGSSGRTSHEEGRKSCLNKLESYVRASLKGQNYEQSRDM